MVEQSHDFEAPKPTAYFEEYENLPEDSKLRRVLKEVEEGITRQLKRVVPIEVIEQAVGLTIAEEGLDPEKIAPLQVLPGALKRLAQANEQVDLLVDPNKDARELHREETSRSHVGQI